MTTYHGDCIGPVGAKLYHATCPHTWTSLFTGLEHVCACACHGEAQNHA